MKKKHLKNLSSLEKWLSKTDLLGHDLIEAIQKIKSAVENIPEEEAVDDGVIPPPVEIAGEPNTFALYSDGGCRGNPGPGAFAYLVQEHDGKVVIQGGEFESHSTNNKMELSGPIHGLKELQEILPGIGKDALLTKVKVMTDSKYVVDGMKSWVSGWKSRGWKKADNKAPENLELWQELDSVAQKFLQVEWVWVKGHGGHPQNEYCDRKANELMDENIS